MKHYKIFSIIHFILISCWASSAFAALPAIPAGVSATAVDATSILLNWSEGSTVTRYNVYRGDSATTVNRLVVYIVSYQGKPPVKTFTNKNLLTNHTYYYAVSACNASGCTKISSVVSATPPALPSPSPTPSPSPSPLAHNLNGKIESIDADGTVHGWFIDLTAAQDPTKSVALQIGTAYNPAAGARACEVITNVVRTARPDINAMYGYSGNFGFQAKLPDGIMDYMQHSISFYLETPDNVLCGGYYDKNFLFHDNSGYLMNLTAISYTRQIGALESSNSKGEISGWLAVNTNDLYDLFFVVDGGSDLFDGNEANCIRIYRPELNQLTGVSGNLGFSCQIPTRFEGTSHTIYSLWDEGTAPFLSNTLNVQF